MISGIRMLRRGGASLLAAACLVTACSGSADDPAGDVPGDDAGADTTTDDRDVDDIEADDTEVGDNDPDDAADERDMPGSDDPLSRFVTQDTPDGTYTMAVDDSATLELPQGTTSPAVTGTAVDVFDVASLADSGVAQWEIRAIERGESTITATVDGRSHTWTIAVD